MDADGGNPTRLTNNNAYDESPIWSPDGSRIAFVSQRDGSRAIYVMGGNGESPTRITFGSIDCWDPAWSPDGSQIVFVYGNKNDDYGNIWVNAANGGGSGISIEDNYRNWDPAWSPDGSRIAYVRSCDIYTEKADGGNSTLIFDSARCHYQPKPTRSPVWSPNGRRIAFYFHGPDPNFDIYVMDAEGHSLTRLTEHAADDESPVWSPTGLHLAFTSDREGDFDIYVMDAEGHSLTRLTEHAADDESPVWSPTGSRIAFVSFRDGNREIYVVDVD